jgi:hypothetical protein
MARNNMTVVVQVKDQATSRIKNISDALKELGVVTSSVASKFDSLNNSIANSVGNKLGGKSKGGKFSLGDSAYKGAMADNKEKAKALNLEEKQEQARQRRVMAFQTAMAKQRASLDAAAAKKQAMLGKAKERSQIKQLSEDAKKGVIDMTQFNKTMFTTLAFVGMFTKAFSSFSNSIKEASELDRVSREYERVFGDTGTLMSNIKGFTTTAVDRMEAMRSAISLGQLGIAQDSKQASEIIGMAATAAKMAGKDSAEGISKVTEALKTGSLSALEFLNEIRSADPALKVYLATLNKAGGALGTAMTAQAKYNLILNTLRVATKDHLKDEADLADVVLEVGQSFGMMRMTVGRLLGTALTPFINKMSQAFDSVGEFYNRIRQTDKTLPTFIKNMVSLASSVSLVIATVGTARLLFKGLSSLGIGGLPLLSLGFIGLGAAFSQSGNSLDNLLDTFKTFGSVAAGVFQLVQSFIMDPENYAKGIGKMDRTLHDFLQKKGLLNLTQNMAKLTSVVVDFSLKVGDRLKDFYDTYLEPVISGLSKLFGMTAGPMSRTALGEGKESNTGYKTAVNVAAIGIATMAGTAIFKSIFSKIPFLGNIFSGAKKAGGSALAPIVAKVPLIGGILTKALGGSDGTGKPKGTSEDPLYTKNVDALADAAGTAAASAAGAGATTAVAGATTAVAGGVLTGLALTSIVASVAALLTSGPTNGPGQKPLKYELEEQEKQRQAQEDAANKTAFESISTNYHSAKNIVAANVPQPLSQTETTTLESNIKNLTRDTRDQLIDAVMSRNDKADKQELKSLLDDPDAFAKAVEKAINAARISKAKPAKHAVKSGRC